MVKNSQPFICDRCRAQPKKNFHIFPATKTWLISYPEDHTVHLHFGHSTWTAEESTAQAQWIHDQFVNIIAQGGGKRWFVLVDMSRLDDSTFPSEEAKELYRRILQLSQIDRVVFYGVSTSLAFLVTMILRFSKSVPKAKIVHVIYEAEELYRKWKEEKS